MRHGGFLEYIDYMLWKALALVFLAFCWGLYRGFIDRPLGVERREQEKLKD